MPVGSKACIYVDVGNALFSKLELIWLIASLIISKMCKDAFLAKSSLQHDISDTPSAYHSIHLLSIMVSINWLACVVGGIREQASGDGAASYAGYQLTETGQVFQNITQKPSKRDFAIG